MMTHNATREIILASASPRRRELLSGLGLSFKVHPSDVEETVEELPDDPKERVHLLAKRKARSVADHYSQGLVLGVDTVVALPGRILEKPIDARAAANMLRELSGGWHAVYSGLTLIDIESDRELSKTVCTDVHFLPLDEQTIEAYVATGEPLDKAGAYGIQGRAAVFIDEIRGDYYNVVGLPLAVLAGMFRNFGYEVLRG